MTNSVGKDGDIAQAEIHEYLENRVARKRLLPRAILVGLVSGTIAVAFRLALESAEHLRVAYLQTTDRAPAWNALAIGVLATVGTYVALLIGRFDKNAGGSGIPHMKAVLEGHSAIRWQTLIPVKFGAAWAAIGSGLALGREGPTVQMGGAVGAAISDLTRASKRERRALTASGAGAGLAAAFNAPLAGVTFVLEELQRDFQPVVFAAALLSASIATVVSRLVSGQASVFAVPHIAPPSLGSIPLFVLIGVAAGFVGVLFNRGLLQSASIFKRKPLRKPWKIALIAGAGATLATLVSPDLLGGGHGLSEAALRNTYVLGAAALYLVIRMLFVHVSYATGVPGGIFAPLLSIGALLGALAFQVSSLALPNVPSVAACAVAGMCALFSGVVRAPLTGVILIAEMTGSYDMLLPLLAAAFAAYAVAEGLRDVPIYEALLQRDALIKGWNLEDGELLTREFEVQSGSPFDGKAVRDLGLPQGVLIVLCRVGGKEFVPRSDTVLREHMRLVVAAGTREGLLAVQQGIDHSTCDQAPPSRAT